MNITETDEHSKPRNCPPAQLGFTLQPRSEIANPALSKTCLLQTKPVLHWLRKLQQALKLSYMKNRFPGIIYRWMSSS